MSQLSPLHSQAWSEYPCIEEGDSFLTVICDPNQTKRFIGGYVSKSQDVAFRRFASWTPLEPEYSLLGSLKMSVLGFEASPRPHPVLEAVSVKQRTSQGIYTVKLVVTRTHPLQTTSLDNGKIQVDVKRTLVDIATQVDTYAPPWTSGQMLHRYRYFVSHGHSQYILDTDRSQFVKVYGVHNRAQAATAYHAFESTQAIEGKDIHLDELLSEECHEEWGDLNV